MNFETKFEKLSAERKKLSREGKNPEWLTTPAWQMIKDKYLTKEDNNLKKTFHRISKICANHLSLPEEEKQKWQDTFFKMMWKGDLALSTPILSNLGTDKGMPVACTGNVCEDSVYSFYNTTLESAVLSQEGFGTSTYLGYIRPRGSKISRGGTASGVLPVIKQFVQMSRDITQGVRRGAWAGYLEITHGDFWEVINYLEHNPQDLNIGWLITDEFIENLKNNDEDSLNRYKRALKVKLVTGKGYFFFIDRANRNAPEEMKKHGLVIKASNLCIAGDSELEFSYNANGEDSWKERLIDFHDKACLGFYSCTPVYVKSYNIEKKMFEFKEFHGTEEKDEVDEIYEIEYNGNVLSCTGDHKILTERGMVEAQHLLEEDIIISE